MKKQMCFYVVLGLFVVCSAISGCKTDEDIVEPTEEGDVEGSEPLDVVAVTDRYDGDSIYFKQGSTFYEGEVVSGIHRYITPAASVSGGL